MMAKRMFRTVLILGLAAVFFLFGSMRLNWSVGEENPLRLGVALHLDIPNAARDRQTAPNIGGGWLEKLQCSIFNALGEEVPRDVLRQKEAILSMDVANTRKMITPRSIWNRLKALVRIEREPGKGSANAV